MKAITVSRPGDSSVLEYGDVPDPEPVGDRLIVRLEAAGVNFLDIQQRLQRYPGGISFPYVPGLEGAGTVTATGPEAGGFAVGERVAVCDVLGCYAEYVAVPAGRAVRVPDGIDLRTAAAALLQGLTAEVMTAQVHAVREGDWILVHAGAGGTGLMLIQAAKKRGAVVVTTVSTEEKAAAARQAGAGQVILYTERDFAEACRSIAGFPGFAAIYDSVGSDTLEKGLPLLRPRGVMVSLGKSAGPLRPLDLDSLNRLGSLFITRPNMMHYLKDPRDLAAESENLFRDIAAGDCRVRIGATYPLAGAAEAQDALAGRGTIGKLLLIP